LFLVPTQNVDLTLVQEKVSIKNTVSHSVFGFQPFDFALFGDAKITYRNFLIFVTWCISFFAAALCAEVMVASLALQ
jgi:hypothetical protein